MVGFDQREAVVYHTFCQSILEKTSKPVAFVPLVNTAIGQKDGSNSFTYSRFLTPYLMGFEGWAIYADGDMICQEDIAKLDALKDPSKAVMLVKHDYKTKASTKYFGSKNEDYPRKNWSSLILWNCAHPKNRVLTPEFVTNSSGEVLHRFAWLDDKNIGELDPSWNWLASEYPDNYQAKIIHYTLGSPCFEEYKNSQMSSVWHEHFGRMIGGMQ